MKKRNNKSDSPNAPGPERRAVEDLIDETIEQSFPASDAPAWGSAARRMQRRKAPARPVKRSPEPGKRSDTHADGSDAP